MKRAVILLVALGAMLTLAAGVAVAANVDCGDSNRERCEGTNNRDNIEGTNGRDVIVAKDGNDDIDANGGRDNVDAGRGNDFIDVRNNDFDVVNCGPGFDRVRADNQDDTRNCDNNVNRD